ncbi:MAG: TIGR00297 family protein [cyanobacterium endosymbiont of Rhopalodia musculus]|uniref:TIGR00297 family protein n=1 Tax=cyanobacterium endosymbiont of Epithemia clementina EcSB TaxID=3034674 RepID=UPI0024811565|nr:TIGR00297 family protein [cyanobacterium endosymbiont of Epithemia clementina EcSB]WGT67011.1 TIGR00297 family protein [cyanobacterium endosymbiont of Epithemia clementina EcSB]
MEITNSWFIANGLNSLLIVIALIVPKKLLTIAGYFHAWVLGILVWGTLGWQGYTVIMFYFLVGSAVTRIGIAEKEAAGIAEKRSGMRGPENIWGSALIAILCALMTLFFDSSWQELLILGYVASFSTKLSDTTASEIGKAYGKSTFLITTFKPVPRGTEGAVSLEGTLAGVIASGVIALLAWGIGLINLAGVFLCIFSAFIATSLESLIGATLQEKSDWMTNEVVNVFNTFIGAFVAIFAAWGWTQFI